MKKIISGVVLLINIFAFNVLSVAKTTDKTTSALATGTWYKIGITKTGFYKIDQSFITSMGINPANVNPANIRIFGNGGHMLAEANSVDRPSDLVENAVLVNSGSDNTFTANDNAIFYAVGPVEWDKDSLNKRFTHKNNLYSDTAYYFISFDNGPGLRVGGSSTTPTGTVQTVTDFNYYDVHEEDLVNPGELGKSWYGEEFSTEIGNSQTFTFDLGTPVSSIYCDVAFASVSDVGGNVFSVSVNNTAVGSSSFGGATPPDGIYVMLYNNAAWTAACNSQTANVGIDFYPVDGSGAGWLDYIEINCRRNLVMTTDQMNFRDWNSVGAGNIANYQLQGANGSTVVWDITNPQVPVRMSGSLSGTTYSFTQDAAMLHEFAAMNSTNLFTPKFIEKTANQNLHGAGQVDCIIVTSPVFLDQANQLANYHHQHDNMRVIVATTTQVYNEFSSGAQDISAIRDFARMFYKRAGTDSTQKPGYLILYGGASYDYKNRIANNCNFVPIFESQESLQPLQSFSGDDFFGFLDDTDDINSQGIHNVLGIAVGRLPARSTNDANVLLNKILNYNSAATLGPWRLSATFVSDKGCVGGNLYDDAGNHMYDAESMAGQVAATGSGLYNEGKVYVDAIPITTTPAGNRCPNANAALDDQVFKGTFLINYNGHGNPTVWSGERILTEDDFNSWNNVNMLPFMVTATCDFGQYDHPEFVSSAEQMVVRNGGGVIVILTTTEAVYSGPNHQLNIDYLASQFARNANGTWNTFGYAYRQGKNNTYAHILDSETLINFRKFALLGDPALTPDFPQYKVTTDSIMDGVTAVRADTVKALGSYVMNGSVRDLSGNILTGFNGVVSVSFYDKARTIPVIDGCTESFQLQDNTIYKGRATVTNGLFSVSFITPKDIDYFYGNGKISAYAQNSITDGAGSDGSYTVGGFSANPIVSSNPPVVKAYINDSLFLNGGITGNNTSLFVSLSDETGITVSGTNVGHDMTAVLDGNTEQPYILNDYYESDPNTYKHGTVTFPMTGLADGHHTITVKAWDVNDNTGEGSVDFVVVDGAVADIQSLGNYPNPFTNTTNFVFEHNHPDEQMDVQIEIYNVGGALVKNIAQTFTPTGSRSSEISWDGTDINGNRLPSGVYVYRLNISTEKGYKTSAYQKLVIVR